MRGDVHSVVVSSDADMVHPGHPPDVVDVLHHVVHRGHLLLTVVFQEAGVEVDHDDSSHLGDCLKDVVRDVPGMAADSPGTRVGEDDGSESDV